MDEHKNIESVHPLLPPMLANVFVYYLEDLLRPRGFAFERRFVRGEKIIRRYVFWLVLIVRVNYTIF